MEFRFSPYGVASTIPAPVNAMTAAFATEFRDGVDINLGVGYVNEATIPRTAIAEALDAVIADPTTHRQPFNYGGPGGAENLHAALRRFYARRAIGGLDAAAIDELAIAAGAAGSTSLLDAVGDLLGPGIVVTSDPLYYIYCDSLERKGFEILAVPEDAAGVRTDVLEAKLLELGDRAMEIAFFYFVTVNNPTCSVLSNARRRRIVELAERFSLEQDRKIPVFFDTAYELLTHDPTMPAFESGLRHDNLGIVYEFGTLSKVFAPALRVGHMIGRPGPFFDAVVQRTSDIGLCGPIITQEIAAWLLDHRIDGQLARVNAGYREKSERVRAAIERCLGEYLEDLRGGEAGFYYYLTLRDVETHTKSRFFAFLSRTAAGAPDGPRVIYIPGEYCVHRAGDLIETGRRQLRISYGFEEVERIEAALEIMADAIAYTLR